MTSRTVRIYGVTLRRTTATYAAWPSRRDVVVSSTANADADGYCADASAHDHRAEHTHAQWPAGHTFGREASIDSDGQA